MIGARVKITEPRGFEPCPYCWIFDIFRKPFTRVGEIMEINTGGYIKLKIGENESMAWTLRPGTIVEFL